MPGDKFTSKTPHMGAFLIDQFFTGQVTGGVKGSVTRQRFGKEENRYTRRGEEKPVNAFGENRAE